MAQEVAASKPWLLSAAMVSLAFVVATAVYNRYAITTLTTPQGEFGISDAENIIAIGRWLSSAGIVWAIGKSLVAVDWRRQFLHGLAAVAILCACTAGLQSVIKLGVKTAVESLPAEQLYGAYQLAFYRHKIIKGEIEDPDIPLSKPLTTGDRVMLAGFGLAAWSDRIMGPAQLFYEREGELQATKARGMVTQNWAEISQKIADLDKYTALLSTGTAEFDAAYDGYIQASNRASTGRIVGRVISQEVALHTGGVLIDAGATKEQFAKALAEKSVVNRIREGAAFYLKKDEYAQRISDANNQVVFDSRAGHVIRVKDLPRPFTQEVVMNFIDAKAREISKDLLPTQENIRESRFGIGIAASVIAPPLLIATSILTILMNAFAAVAMLGACLAPAKARPWISGFAVPASFAAAISLTFALPDAFEGTAFHALEETAGSQLPALKIISKALSAESHLLSSF